MSRKFSEEAISLSQLQERVGRLVAGAAELHDQWVIAELCDARPSGGHFYTDLIEKDSAGTAVARLRANIWRGQAVKLQNMYGKEVWNLLANGMEVKVRGSLNAHPLFGVSFNIQDIDPEYQRDTSRIQAEILAALRKDGVLGDNKELVMPEVAQSIAVISSPGAAGYGDFMNQLLHNQYRLRFAPRLFPAVMQGVSVSPSVREALAQIEKMRDEFDCVVIIRGGGATSDLAGFDDYALAYTVATCSLPVIVGIGHERDNTVLDFIANTRVKTPTAAAEWLVNRSLNILSRVVDLAQQVANYTRNRLVGDTRQLDYLEEQIPLLAYNSCRRASARLNEITAALPLTVKNRLLAASRRLDNVSRGIETSASNRLTRAAARLDAIAVSLPRDVDIALRREDNRLERLAQAVELLSPANVLARGFSITRVNGKALRSVTAATPGTRLTTTLPDGEITSTTL